MHHQARRLVDHYQRLVLVNHLEGDGLRQPLAGRLLDELYLETLAARDFLALAWTAVVETHPPVPQPALQQRARVLGKQGRQHPVEALSRQLGWNGHPPLRLIRMVPSAVHFTQTVFQGMLPLLRTATDSE